MFVLRHALQYAGTIQKTLPTILNWCSTGAEAANFPRTFLYHRNHFLVVIVSDYSIHYQSSWETPLLMY